MGMSAARRDTRSSAPCLLLEAELDARDRRQLLKHPALRARAPQQAQALEQRAHRREAVACTTTGAMPLRTALLQLCASCLKPCVLKRSLHLHQEMQICLAN